MDAIVEERWREVRRARILAAAGRAFSRSSFSLASMDEIAHEAGIGKPTLYRYFASKDALFGAVFSQVLDELEGRLAEVLAAEGGLDVQITGLAAAIARMFRDHLVSLRLLDGSGAAADQSRRRIFRERRARIGRYLAIAIERGQDRGELRDVDAAKVAQMMLGMIRSATASGEATDVEIAHDVADLVVHGLVIHDLPPSSLPAEAASARSASSRPCQNRSAARAPF